MSTNNMEHPSTSDKKNSKAELIQEITETAEKILGTIKPGQEIVYKNQKGTLREIRENHLKKFVLALEIEGDKELVRLTEKELIDALIKTDKSSYLVIPDTVASVVDKVEDPQEIGHEAKAGKSIREIIDSVDGIAPLPKEFTDKKEGPETLPPHREQNAAAFSGEQMEQILQEEEENAPKETPENIVVKLRAGSMLRHRGSEKVPAGSYIVKAIPDPANPKSNYILEHESGKPRFPVTAEQLTTILASGDAERIETKEDRRRKIALEQLATAIQKGEHEKDLVEMARHNGATDEDIKAVGAAAKTDREESKKSGQETWQEILKAELPRLEKELATAGYDSNDEPADEKYDQKTLAAALGVITDFTQRIQEGHGVDLSPQFKPVTDEFENAIKVKQGGDKDEKDLPDEEKENQRDSLIQAISNEEAEEIVSKVEIHGDEFQGKRLTSRILKEAGLLPKYKINIDNKIVWFSSSGYKLGSGRVGIVAYVEKDGEIVARSYYQSNSQGVWRYLPSYLPSSDGVGWFSKGYSENSISLPVQMQAALAEITREKNAILDVPDPELVFAGTARKIFNDPTITYRREVKAIPVKLGNFAIIGDKIDPEIIRLPGEKSPNLDPEKVLHRWTQTSKQYGKINMEAVPSQDGSLIFTFCRDNLGRVWIGNIEDNSEIGSTGIRQNWIDAGDLTTPAYEYYSQAGDYGNDDINSGNYVDMFANYLSQIPVIRDYCESRSISLPPLKKVEALSNEEKLKRLERIKDLFNSIEEKRKEELSKPNLTEGDKNEINEIHDVMIELLTEELESWT